MSSQSAASVGLGIHTQAFYGDSDDALSDPEHRSQGQSDDAGAERHRPPRRTLTGPRAPRRSRTTGSTQQHHAAGTTGLVASSTTLDSLGMRTSQYRSDPSEYMLPSADAQAVPDQGSRIVLEPMPPPRESDLPRLQRRASTGDRSHVSESHGTALPRDVTLLSFGGSHTRSAAELKALLGNANARLKPGAVLLPDHARGSSDKKVRKEHGVALEQAKTRARVEVDIVLESSVCVQGGHLRGHIKIRVRKRSKKESPILLSEGKVRIIGYESLTSEDENHTFYHYAAPFSTITDSCRNLYESTPDEEGFSTAVEGVHVLPFALQLPTDNSFGCPKGVIAIGSAISVRYIATISIKVKDSGSGKRSIAHFYRQCEVWPYLDPSSVLQAASRPLQASTAKSMALIGTSSKVRLNAQMHRLYWPAGSRCPVSLHVSNGSKKTIKTVVLTLVRTTTVFRPRPTLDAGGDRDPDSCQTATVHKAVSESVLEICAGVAKGRVSAKGWWTGVAPGRDLDFVHHISIPADALSVTRARLLEVEYSIHVTISAGSLSPDVSVTLPVRVFNFISIDPPPTAGLLSSSGAYIRPSQSLMSHNTEPLPMSCTELAALASNNKLLSLLEEEEPDQPPLPPYASRAGSLRVTNPDEVTDSDSVDANPPKHRMQHVDSESSMYSTSTSGNLEDMSASSSTVQQTLGNLELDDKADSQEEIKAVIGSAKVCHDMQASASTLLRARSLRSTKSILRNSKSEPGVSSAEAARRVEDRTPRMEGIDSGAKAFATRVQAKQRSMAMERLKQRTRTHSHASGVRGSMSAFLPDASTDETTPRLGYATVREYRRPWSDIIDLRALRPSTSEPGNDFELHAESNKDQPRNPRQLPHPPSTSSSHRSSLYLRTTAAEEGLPPAQSSAPVSTSGSRLLPTPPSADKSGLPPDPRIPPVPPIPAHILAMCTRQISRDSDPLRKAIIRPPKIPTSCSRSRLLQCYLLGR